MSSIGRGHKASKFKVGDMVEITGGNRAYHSHKIGDIGEVDAIGVTGSLRILVGTTPQWVQGKDLRKVSKGKVSAVNRKCNIKFDEI